MFGPGTASYWHTVRSGRGDRVIQLATCSAKAGSVPVVSDKQASVKS